MLIWKLMIITFFKLSKVGIILEMPWHMDALCIAGSKCKELLFGGRGDLVSNTISKGTAVSFSKHLTWQTDSKFHTERGRVLRVHRTLTNVQLFLE